MSRVSGVDPAVEISALSRRFGAVHALDRVDLTLERGGSLALFGPNGAGKTTLIRILTLGLRPHAGSFRVLGLEPDSDGEAVRAAIGVISHRAYLYDDLTARQNLELFARLYGVENPATRSDELLERFRIAHRGTDAVRNLSRGLRQRVALARALVHDPPLLLLDEPFSGLDPLAAEMLCSTLAQLREQGRTVILVTHDLKQGLALTDRWVVLVRGRIAESGNSADVDAAGFEDGVFKRVVS